MRLIKNYMNDDTLRHELNALTKKTFGFSFEDWVNNGYYKGDYIPYSFECDGQLISNASVNLMRFIQNNKKKSYIQIGTVMTDEDHRNKGHAKKLIEYIIKDYEDKCDGIYLFGDLNALDFYKKIGFVERLQYQYMLKECYVPNMHNVIANQTKVDGFKKLNPDDNKSKEKYIEAVKHCAASSALDQENKFGLQMFYTADLKNVYYSSNLDCFIAMNCCKADITIHSVIYSKHIPLEKIISEINVNYKCLKLGFAPKKEDEYLFESTPYDGGNDYRLLCLGSQLDSIEQQKLYFPTYSHA